MPNGHAHAESTGETSVAASGDKSALVRRLQNRNHAEASRHHLITRFEDSVVWRERRQAIDGGGWSFATGWEGSMLQNATPSWLYDRASIVAVITTASAMSSERRGTQRAVLKMTCCPAVR